MAGKFAIKLERSRSQTTADEYIKTKNETVLDFARDKEAALRSVREWDIYLSLTQYRTVITLHFVLDLETTLTDLSLQFQGQDLAPSSLRFGILNAFDRLELMHDTDGQAVTEFTRKYNEEDEISEEGFNLEGREEGHALFMEDRKEIIECTLTYMKARFDPLLTHPVLKYFETPFEHRLWPPRDDPRFESWGDDAIRALALHYASLTSMRDFDLKEALH
mmetsp:Transcript_18617/g.42386  ORF Transcript_18617/g.42386 Transcript_18617/m.42386 type:complete len:220 (-) Transcript_18617:286-945(-)